MRTVRVLLSLVLLVGILVHPRSAAANGGQFGLEFAIDAPWRIEPAPKPGGGYTFGPIPITITFHDAIFDHYRSSIGQFFANFFIGPLEKRHVGVLSSISITEVRHKNGRVFHYTPQLALGNIREIERKRWISTKNNEPRHELCRPHLGQNCQPLYDITDSHEWHAMLWYTPSDTEVVPGENIQLMIKVVTRYEGEERHWVNAVVVHAGEAPLPRFDNQWLYGDLHYHSQMTDNEGESGYSYRNVVRSLGALGMDFLFATDHASDSEQVDGGLAGVGRCGTVEGSRCAFNSTADLPQLCQEGGQTKQCVGLQGVEARDLNQARFTKAKEIIYGPDGANQAIGRDLQTNGFPRYRSAGIIPQIYMGEEVDAMPEISSQEFLTGQLSYGDGLVYPWSNVNQCLAQKSLGFCSRFHPELENSGYAGCANQPIAQLCRERYSTVRELGSGRRFFTQDNQGIPHLDIQPEPSRQHLVYFPVSGLPDENGFISSRTRNYGGASLRLEEVLREVEAKGVTFLAHPLASGKPGSQEGPDVLPYSDLALDRAWSSRAVLGLQFWNENPSVKSQVDTNYDVPLTPPYDRHPYGALITSNFPLTDRQAQMLLQDMNYIVALDQIQRMLPEINRLRMSRSRVWENSLPDGGKSYTAMRPFLYPTKPLFLGNISHDDLIKPWGWKASAGPGRYSRLYQGAFTWDRYLRKGLTPSETSGLISWLAPGEPRKWFMAGGSDAHGDINYRREGYLCRSEWCEDEAWVDTAIGNPRNLVLVGTPEGIPLPGTQAEVRPFTNGQVIDALRAGRFSVTDGPAIQIAIDRNRNGSLDDDDFHMGTVFNLFPGEQIPLLIEWMSTPEFGRIKKIDIYLGTKDRTYAPEGHGPAHTVCAGVRTINRTELFLKPGGTLEEIKTGKELERRVCEESVGAYFRQGMEVLRIDLTSPELDSSIGYSGRARVYLTPTEPFYLTEHNGKLFYVRAYAQTYGRAELVFDGPKMAGSDPGEPGNWIHPCIDNQHNPLPPLTPGKCGDRHAYSNPIWGRYNQTCGPSGQSIDGNGNGMPDTCEQSGGWPDMCVVYGRGTQSCSFVESLPCRVGSASCGTTEAAGHLLLLN